MFNMQRPTTERRWQFRIQVRMRTGFTAAPTHAHIPIDEDEYVDCDALQFHAAGSNGYMRMVHRYTISRAGGTRRYLGHKDINGTSP